MSTDVYLSILPYLELPDYVIKVLEVFEQNGYRAYVVGGAVRDMLRRAEVHDYDVATEADPHTTKRLFSFCPTYDTGIKHGTVTVNMDGHMIEVTTFRTDGRYTDSRHPESVIFTTSIEEDLARRDFTVNAMALDVECRLVDPYNGLEDLGNNIIRAVGNPRIRFSEDALRIMRAYRFSATLQYRIEHQTLLATAVCADGLNNISRERIEIEWRKLLLAQFCSGTLVDMYDYCILPMIFPLVRFERSFLELIETLPIEYGIRSAAVFKDVPADALRAATERICLRNTDFEYIRLILEALCVLRTDPDPELRLFCYEFGEAALAAARIAVLEGSVGRALTAVLQDILSDRSLVHGRNALAVTGNDILSCFDVDRSWLTPIFSQILAKVLMKQVSNEKSALIAVIPNILSEIEADIELYGSSWRKLKKYSLK